MCVCANCQEMITFTSPQLLSWPDFNYSGINSLNILVEENVVCISSLDLALTYTKRESLLH